MSTARHEAPITREMECINWLEFREWIPANVQTVLARDLLACRSLRR